MAPGERQKSEHKCRYQSRKMQRAVVAQGMLETKTNSYHSESRGSHPTEGRRRGGQLTSCRERLRGLGEGGTTPKAWHRGRMRLLKTGSPSQPAKLAITRQLRGLRAGVCVCVCAWVFLSSTVYRLLAIRQVPGERESLNTHLDPGQAKMNY